MRHHTIFNRDSLHEVARALRDAKSPPTPEVSVAAVLTSSLDSMPRSESSRYPIRPPQHRFRSSAAGSRTIDRSRSGRGDSLPAIEMVADAEHPQDEYSVSLTDSAQLPTRSVQAPSPPSHDTDPSAPSVVTDDARSPALSRDALASPTSAPTAAPARGEAIGTLMGPYLIIDTLGEGGMGRVYRAFDRTLGRQVALKVLHRNLAAVEQTRLVQEARAMAQLSHPNVVQVYEVGEHQGQIFVVMELVVGQTLRQWIQQQPRPNWKACTRVYQQAGAGLAAAHEHDLVHRDFKPANVLIDHRGRVRVLDFGLARIAAEPSIERATIDISASNSYDILEGVNGRLTRTGMVMGTPAYMSPEQMRGDQIDARSDQFSFCVSLFEAVYGQRPFEGEDLNALETAIRQGRVGPLRTTIKASAALHKILVRGLAFDPAQRWPSMAAVLDEMDRLVAPRRYGRWILGASLGLGLTALGTGLTYQAEIDRQTEHARELELAQRCSGAAAELEGIWDDDRRAAVQTAISSTERSYAAQTGERVRSRLDDYADAWARSYTETCEATSVRHEQSQDVMDLRIQCLRERKVALAAAVGVLAEADADVVTRAVEVASSMPKLDRCSDVSWLEQRRQRVPPPEDPERATKAEALRQQLAVVRAKNEAGQYDQALEQVETIVEQAEALSYGPLLAEALLRRGDTQQARGRYDEAESDLERAFTIAAEHGHDPVVVQAASALTFVVGYRQARIEPGLGWARTARALSRGPELEPTDEAAALNGTGAVLRQQGSYDDALEVHRRALAIQEQALGPDHPAIAKTLDNIGIVLNQQGKFAQSLEHHRRVLAIQQRALGPDHPNNGSTLGNIGNSLYLQGDLDQALDHHYRALAIFEQALDPTTPSSSPPWATSASCSSSRASSTEPSSTTVAS